MTSKSVAIWILSTTLVLSPSILFPTPQVVQDQTTLPILTPSFAERKTYKMILENGIEVFLISDPLLSKSGAALSVEVGSWNDPKEYPGMAHLLEHMLFMGTKAYPNEAEYMQYIQEHGGLYNAMTAPDRTIYMFSINPADFDGALDRFSHFFIDPLFSRSSIARELHAVDQEHSKNIQNDGNRLYQILKETGNPSHPNAQFCTGNAQTLSGIPQEAMIAWYKKFYSASRMHLVMMSTESIDQMKALAEKCFSTVPVSSYNPKPVLLPMLSDQQKGAYIYVKPVKDLKVLSLLWEIPSNFITDYTTQVPELVSYVLSSVAENTLAYTLKKQQLAEEVTVSVDRYSKREGFFSIDISLTERGLAQKEKIISECFAMISRLKQEGIPESIFNEMKQLDTINYEYQTREDVFATLTTYANDMIDEPLSTFPQAGEIPTAYSAAKIQAFLKTLTPSSAVYFVVADPTLTGVEPNRKEKWVGAEYSIKPVAPSLLTKWNNEPLQNDLLLPSPNPYIPSNFTLLAKGESSLSKTPQLVVNTESCLFYHLTDSEYLVPEVYMNFGFRSPLIDGSAKSAALLALYNRAFTEALSTTLDAASNAGLNGALRFKDMKLELLVNGFSDKASLFSKTLLSHLKTVHVTKDQFDLYKQSLISDFDNAGKELPFRQALELLNSVLVNDAPLSSDKMAELEKLTLQDFNDFSSTLFNQSFIEALVYGNVSLEESKELYSTLQTVFTLNENAKDNEPNRKVLLLPEDKGPFCIKHSTPMQGNSCLLTIEQGPMTLENRSIQQIFSMPLDEAFSDTLRTKQQTGYIAKAFNAEIEKRLFMSFIVQSASHTAEELLARYDLFLESFIKTFSDRIPESRFNEIKTAYLADLSHPLDNLMLMGERLYTLAFLYNGDFDWIQKRIDATQKITYSDVQAFAETTLSRKNKKRIAVLIDGEPTPDVNFRYEEVTPQELVSESRYSP